MQVTITVDTEGLDLTEDKVRQMAASAMVTALHIHVMRPLFKEIEDWAERRPISREKYLECKARVKIE